MAHPSQAASLPSEIEPHSVLVVVHGDGPTAADTRPESEPINLVMGRMGTPLAYKMTRPEWIKYGGVGCRVCWRWMDFNAHEIHKTGKQHQKRLKQHPPGDRQWTAFTTPETVFEIMFAAASHKQPLFTSDPDVNLKGMNSKNIVAAVSDSQPMSASDPAGDLEPTDEDRAAWAASQAAAEEEWRMSQAGPVEGRMGYYGGPSPWEMLLPEPNWEPPRVEHPPIPPSSSGTSGTNVHPPPPHFRHGIDQCCAVCERDFTPDQLVS